MNIIQNIVKRGDKTYGRNNGKKYITIHETGNPSKGADAIAHGKLQQSGFSASWHYSVDDTNIVQSYSHDTQCWHAGDGRGNGNLNSIGIEICINADGNFKKAVENAVKLVRKIMADENIKIENVVQHNKWSGKNCPANLRKSGWDDFIKAVKGEVKPPVVKPTPQAPKPPANKPVSGYAGNSIVDYLKSIKVDSSIGDRRKLAAQYGIKGYTATAAQNTLLLNAMRKGAAPTPVKPAPVSFKVGSKVKIKSSAGKYSRTNVSIPAKYKNKTMTIDQVGKDDVLIKELVSWVKKSNLV